MIYEFESEVDGSWNMDEYFLIVTVKDVEKEGTNHFFSVVGDGLGSGEDIFLIIYVKVDGIVNVWSSKGDTAVQTTVELTTEVTWSVDQASENASVSIDQTSIVTILDRSRGRSSSR